MLRRVPARALNVRTSTRYPWRYHPYVNRSLAHEELPIRWSQRPTPLIFPKLLRIPSHSGSLEDTAKPGGTESCCCCLSCGAHTFGRSPACLLLADLHWLVPIACLLLAAMSSFLDDLVELPLADLPYPQAVEPFCSNFPDCKLYSSSEATRVLRSGLDGTLPGAEGVSYALVLETLDSCCFLVGGQVSSALRFSGESQNREFAYSGSARDVALTCVKNEWPIKYSATDGGRLPNHVRIGEGSDACLEGFALSHKALSDLSHGEFRHTQLVYCLTNE